MDTPPILSVELKGGAQEAASNGTCPGLTETKTSLHGVQAKISFFLLPILIMLMLLLASVFGVAASFGSEGRGGGEHIARARRSAELMRASRPGELLSEEVSFAWARLLENFRYHVGLPPPAFLSDTPGMRLRRRLSHQRLGSRAVLLRGDPTSTDTDQLPTTTKNLSWFLPRPCLDARFDSRETGGLAFSNFRERHTIFSSRCATVFI